MAPLMAHSISSGSGAGLAYCHGVSGVRPGKIVVLGAGVVGTNAARVASAWAWRPW